jgi:hypothetical protein
MHPISAREEEKSSSFYLVRDRLSLTLISLES